MREQKQRHVLRIREEEAQLDREIANAMINVLDIRIDSLLENIRVLLQNKGHLRVQRS